MKVRGVVLEVCWWLLWLGLVVFGRLLLYCLKLLGGESVFEVGLFSLGFLCALLWAAHSRRWWE
jgi:uncharacterized membrane protein